MKNTTLHSIGQNIEGKICNSLGVISIKTSNHSWCLFWLQLWHWTHKSVFDWTFTHARQLHATMSSMSCPPWTMVEKLYLRKKWKWQKWMEIWFLSSNRV